MHLSALLEGLPNTRLIGDGALAIGNVTADSRAVKAGDVFVATRGRSVDGHQFIPAALAAGAAALVVEAVQPGVTVPQVIVPSGAVALGHLWAARMGFPAQRLGLIGITGTNGKTTTTYVVERILQAAARVAGVIGTVTYRWPGFEGEAPYTTPTPEVLHTTFDQMLRHRCTDAVMEVSSAALSMDRLAGVQFKVGAFSNLTQDHLDVHGSMDAYQAAKTRLFTDHLTDDGVAVINVDDPAGEAMAAAVAPGRRVLRVSSEQAPTRQAQREAEIRVTWCESTVRGIRATLETPAGSLQIEAAPLLGAYNVANLALAVGIGCALGIGPRIIEAGIAALPGVPGRVERVANDQGLDILVDYAHTPDALDNVLRALRPLTARRLICVFGCGGDRDPTKRPKMGAAVSALADLPIVTSDNPRTEAPRAILDMILPAVPKPFFVDIDRRTAIRAAIAEATPGDIVLIAGKGHEDYQIIGTTKVHFDDREEAAAACALRARFHSKTMHGLGEVRGPDAVAQRVVIDSRQVTPGDLYVAIRGEAHDGHAFCQAAVQAGAVALLVDRAGVASAPAGIATIVSDDTRLALGQLAAAHRQAWAQKVMDGTATTPGRRALSTVAADQVRTHTLIAVTGSAGKTTTKELVRAAVAADGPTHAADGSLNNETGVPLTLLGLRGHHRYGVVEMGMRGLGQIDYLTRMARPDVAIVVNAGSAHLELLGSADAIAQAKGEIFAGLSAQGTAVVPADDPRLGAWARQLAPQARQLSFGDKAGADVRLLTYAVDDDAQAATLSLEVLGVHHSVRLGLLGRHNATNACAALAAALAAGVPVASALDGLARATPPAMRSSITQVHGRHVLVDCYNANPASMTAALTLLTELRGQARALAIVGDMLELGDHAAAAHQAVGAAIGAHGLDAIALGAWAPTVITAAGRGDAVVEPAAAAQLALSRTRPGDWILLKASRGMRLERVLEAMRHATPT